MGLALLKPKTYEVLDMADVPAALTQDAWASAPEHRRKTASAEEAVLRGLSQDVGAQTLAATLQAQLLAALAGDASQARLLNAAIQAGWVKESKVKSVANLKQRILKYRKNGRDGLLKQHTGRVRQDYGWEMRAVELYNAPSKPGFTSVASWLRKEGFAEATDRSAAPADWA